jgi:tungstate transport system permease protein
MGLMIYECKSQLVSTVLVGFGRAIAEVGAVQIVGGNVQYKTRVMTTAIMMQTNMGKFHFAIALGIVLLIISFGINGLVNYLESRGRK